MVTFSVFFAAPRIAVHVFTPQTRAFYSLERLWGNAERTEVTEAWQERGRDFVTVAIVGTLLDYVVDTTGRVVTGSSTVPDRFEDDWTFTRLVGTRPWQLTAIQTG